MAPAPRDVPDDAAAASVLQRAWRARASHAHARLAAALRELTICAICHDECVHVVRCRNGHACCEGCEMSSGDPRCPMCRVPRAYTRDVTLERVLYAADVPLRCHACATIVRPRECERHRAWCPAHRFVCPVAGCTATVPARDMAAHVERHIAAGEAHALNRRADGSYSLVLGAMRMVGETTALVLDRGTADALTVVVSTVPQRGRPHPPMIQQEDWPLLHVQLYAFYFNPEARAVVATVRQLRVRDCCLPGSFLEEHRCGAVAPMLASRENVLLGDGGPVLVARSRIDAEALAHAGRTLILPDTIPGPQLAHAVRLHGARDAPLVRGPPPAEAGAQIALLQIVLRRDGAPSVEEAYPIGDGV